ncbi:hypothetical protein U4E84_09025 [Halorubrum sp. AD140]|uniref:hypothetical protein n=1 Tax=Halorubrum sp. AD140 TaxID=3050073 RepID=UPI002ACCC493|nr:hypothetical protein [Halorubrum sp. AD140]MDZ5811487.1 hypothetical protein [Halorubrum sp. AD140]
MRLKPLQKETRVFLSMHELQTYLDSCPRRVRIAARIEARASPRIGIVVQLKRKDFYVPDHPDVNIAFVRLRGTKDTRKEESAHGGQFRIFWVPWSLYEDSNSTAMTTVSAPTTRSLTSARNGWET